MDNLIFVAAAIAVIAVIIIPCSYYRICESTNGHSGDHQWT